MADPRLREEWQNLPALEKMVDQNGRLAAVLRVTKCFLHIQTAFIDLV